MHARALAVSAATPALALSPPDHCSPCPVPRPQRFEDGTLPFIEILALKYGAHSGNGCYLRTVEPHTCTPGQHSYRTSHLDSQPHKRPALPARPLPPAGLRVFDMLGGPAAIEKHTEALGRFLYEQVRLCAELGSVGKHRVQSRDCPQALHRACS